MQQVNLFDVRETTRAALEQVEGNADQDWLGTAYAAIERVCRALPDFISDDIWETGQLASTREDRALGPVLIRARKAGLCRKTDRVRPSKRSNLSGKPVWISLIYAT